MTGAIELGMFDWIDLPSTGSIADLYDQRIRVVQAAEAAGFRSYHLAEHHATSLGSAPSPNVFLAALSQRTSAIRLVPTVYLLPLYSPYRLAEEICMLDHLSRGRLEFGVGRGASPYEARPFAVDPGDARGMMDEGFEVLLAALRTGTVDHLGAHYTFEQAQLSVTPYQRPHPPVWYAAGSPESTTWSARNALHIVSNLPGARFRPLVELYHEVRRDQGLVDDPINPATTVPFVGLNRQIHVGRTEREAVRTARTAYERFLDNFRGLWHAHGDHAVDRLRSGFDADRERGLVVVGSPAQVQDVLAHDLEAAGANYLSGSFAWGDLTCAEAVDSIELFAHEVAPGLGRHAPVPAMSPGGQP